jgi:hypothetical protein
MELEPILFFYPQKAAINVEYSDDSSKKRSITLVTQLTEDCDVFTVDDRSMRSSSWSIQVIDREVFSEKAKAEQAIGVLSHCPEFKSKSDYLAEACFASVAVDSLVFQTLYDSLKLGKLPNFISLTVRGLTYGYDPDGDDKVWDTDNASNLYITNISITTPLINEETEVREDDYATPTPVQVLGHAIGNGQEQIAAIMQMQNKVTAHLRWLAIIGALILLKMYFK